MHCSLQLCVDYRKLDAVTVRDSSPILRMDESIRPLGDETSFPKLYRNNYYWQVEIAKGDRENLYLCRLMNYFSLFYM